MNTGLDQYMDIFKDAVEDSAAKLTKSFEKILIEVIILFMVIPRKINFTQMGRYGSHVEQTYRNAFGLKKSKSIDWLKLNVSLAKRFFGKQGTFRRAPLRPCLRCAPASPRGSATGNASPAPPASLRSHPGFRRRRKPASASAVRRGRPKPQAHSTASLHCNRESRHRYPAYRLQ